MPNSDEPKRPNRSHIDYTGHKVANLTFVAYIGLEHCHRMWLMRCDCGNMRKMRLAHILNGRSKTCGSCLSEDPFRRKYQELLREYVRVKGHTGNRPHDTYHNFKRKGILCAEWDKDFMAFLKHWLALTGTTLEDWFRPNVPIREFMTYRPDKDLPASPDNLSVQFFDTRRQFHQKTWLYWKQLREQGLLATELHNDYRLFITTFGLKVTGKVLRRRDLTAKHSESNSYWTWTNKNSSNSSTTE